MTARPSTRTINDFATELYGKLRSEPGNLFFSPSSVNVALGMALAGAKGEPRRQLAHVLGAGEDVRLTYARLIEEVNGRSGEERPFKLLTANRLLSQIGFEVHQEYQNLLREVFASEFSQADFRANPDAVVSDVNGWVSDKTNGKIKGLIGRSDITPDTRLILLNAVYLLAEWESPFSKKDTHPADFSLAGGARVQVPLMFRKGHARYYETSRAQHLELLYKGGRLSMLLSLPHDQDLSTLEESWDRAAYEEVVSHLDSEEVMIYLPRFKIETPIMRLKEALCSLDAGVAFSGAADFSGIASEPLAISEVLHKAFIEVDEEKTEAAAATAVMMRLSAALPATPPKVFRADRPFRFDIRDNVTGTILFSGRVADPRK
jgi:serpin B